jgi:hypothetical protein
MFFSDIWKFLLHMCTWSKKDPKIRGAKRVQPKPAERV